MGTHIPHNFRNILVNEIWKTLPDLWCWCHCAIMERHNMYFDLQYGVWRVTTERKSRKKITIVSCAAKIKMETITSSLGTRRKYEHIYSATLKNTAHNLHVLHWSGLEAIATLNQYVCHNMWCDTTVPRLNLFLHNKNTHLWSQCCPLQKNLFETPYSRQYTCVNV